MVDDWVPFFGGKQRSQNNGSQIGMRPIDRYIISGTTRQLFALLFDAESPNLWLIIYKNLLEKLSHRAAPHQVD